ncbi:Fe-S cluster assembly ATPase SufC [Pseudokordiimonas caeni]|uniref:Fe-S cluster assembly ATPase SufC n=1 Tax=Pseudokordiimonas caeni TaxID=2997908 RepID=UPI0028112BDA|nr:Fe-S cluster assembly ATPase SufC [Pseudokordiimonas caeni]
MSNLLDIQNLTVKVGDKQILNGLTLAMKPGEVHAIMGPNGAGKSTLASTLAGREDYDVTGGSVTFNGEDLLALEAHERAAAGVFLGFQYPVEIPGVSNLNFLRTALNSQRKIRGESEVSAAEFMKIVKEKAAGLKMDMDMLKRFVNVGFSGGEKKRNEMVQMAVLNPTLAILDETDSGLDIDALRTVSEGINAQRRDDTAILLITHYQRLLDYVRPDVIHVMAKGKIVRSGGPSLARELEERGYADVA